ncbi:unnamed protein product [Parnassius apollo]|uniref:(apollo) hypothetical protein n=1 Tax=Parnassius apollo TaxID=110799 RepID=A0A8S3WQD7_PARAO|nr:unnamed protein product [Parnassius apollo]
MRKLKNDAGRNLMQPMGTVAITFASNVLPDHVDLHGWRFVIGKKTHIAESYRPIALTSRMGKIFEQLIKSRLEFYLEKIVFYYQIGLDSDAASHLKEVLHFFI